MRTPQSHHTLGRSGLAAITHLQVSVGDPTDVKPFGENITESGSPVQIRSAGAAAAPWVAYR
jgi:hypothetical protein